MKQLIEELLSKIADMGAASCADCETGVAWMNDKAGDEFVAKYPHTFAAMSAVHDAADKLEAALEQASNTLGRVVTDGHIITATAESTDRAPDVGGRLREIQDALVSGCVVKFTNPCNGVVKYLNDATLDTDGEMTAYYSTSATTYLAWDAEQYTADVISADEAAAEIAAHKEKAAQS